MNEQIAKLIANLLNDRGFVLDEDIPELPISYTKFSGWVMENEDIIRNHGYFGGPLKTWTTRFNGPGCAYGVVDSGRDPSREWIEEYCIATEDIKSSQLTISDLKKYGLGLSYICECGHACNKGPSEIPNRHDGCQAFEFTGRCLQCGKNRIQPSETYKPWK